MANPLLTSSPHRLMMTSALPYANGPIHIGHVAGAYLPGDIRARYERLAGNDVLLFAEDVPTAIKKIKEAISAGQITQEEIDARCRKILLAKNWVGLSNIEPIEIEGLVEDLNSLKNIQPKREIIKNSLTLLNNTHKLLPIVNLDSFRIASVVIGDKQKNEFQRSMDAYATVTHFQVGENPDFESIIDLNKKLEEYDKMNELMPQAIEAGEKLATYNAMID